MTDSWACDGGMHFCNVAGCGCECHKAKFVTGTDEPQRTRVRFVDTDARPRGLDALIPTAPRVQSTAADVREFQWRQLEAALFSLTNAQFEYERGDDEAGRMHVEDCRRALGVVALSLSDGKDAEGYARLFGHIMDAPTGRRGSEQ